MYAFHSGKTGIGVRDGGAGGQLPPQKITKSKSRANVQHKSGEKWEIKKPKSPQFVGQTKAVGQYVNFVVNLVLYGKGR